MLRPVACPLAAVPGGEAALAWQEHNNPAPRAGAAAVLAYRVHGVRVVRPGVAVAQEFQDFRVPDVRVVLGDEAVQPDSQQPQPARCVWAFA